jgi:hypothetical protein
MDNGVTVPLFYTSALEVSGQLHALSAMPLVPIGYESEWTSRAGLDALDYNLDSNPGPRDRSPDCIYRLSTPAPQK